MAPVRRSSIAEHNLLEIWSYIAKDNLPAADRWLKTFEKKCELYAHQPELGDRRVDLGADVRCFPVGQYVVLYRPRLEGIVVLTVIHGARDIPTIFRRFFDGDAD